MTPTTSTGTDASKRPQFSMLGYPGIRDQLSTGTRCTGGRARLCMLSVPRTPPCHWEADMGADLLRLTHSMNPRLETPRLDDSRWIHLDSAPENLMATLRDTLQPSPLSAGTKLSYSNRRAQCCAQALTECCSSWEGVRLPEPVLTESLNDSPVRIAMRHHVSACDSAADYHAHSLIVVTWFLRMQCIVYFGRRKL